MLPSPADGSNGGPRPSLMKRQSSASSHNSNKHGALSPGSAGENHQLRHHVKPARHTKIVLPRGHGSGRNLQKLARQQEGDRKRPRQKSHEGDTEIRLPGSLDDKPAPHPMRRNMTAYQLPRNTSHTKLKKNLSHGQLTRLGSGKNLAALNEKAPKGPGSPGVKGARRKRPKSADLGRDIHEQEIELARQQQENDKPKKVGFDVGSTEEDSDAEDAPEMEGSGLQEDEWTDQSQSASPYSTRQNTANNSRRTSVVIDKPTDKHVVLDNGHVEGERTHPKSPLASKSAVEDTDEAEEDAEVEEDQEDEEGEEEEEANRKAPSPRSNSKEKMRFADEPSAIPDHVKRLNEEQQRRRRSLQDAKDHPNPAARHLLSRATNSAAPALVSNVSALDDTHSARGSPTPSMKSSRSNIADASMDQDQDELVSRFILSESHPKTGSGSNTAMTTPKIGSLQTPENESTLAAQRRERPNHGLQPVSPVSTVSGSSGAATPAMGRSRVELKLMNERAVAEMEDQAARNPIIPPHVYDRRNESLKSYLNLAMLGGDGRGGLSATTGLSVGPEIFTGRFKAVNTELKVVQRYRDPIGESVARLQDIKESKIAQLRAQKASHQKGAAKLPISKSAVSLQKQPSKLSTSASPPKSGSSPIKPAIVTAKSSTQVSRGDSRRGKVTFSQTPPDTREVESRADSAGADSVARRLWDSIYT